MLFLSQHFPNTPPVFHFVTVIATHSHATLHNIAHFLTKALPILLAIYWLVCFDLLDREVHVYKPIWVNLNGQDWVYYK